MAVIDAELVTRVTTSTGLSSAEAARLVEDVVAYYSLATEEFVRLRHRQLKAYGMKNADIFEQVAGELAERVVAPPVLSERQLRRIVYG